MVMNVQKKNIKTNVHITVKNQAKVVLVSSVKNLLQEQVMGNLVVNKSTDINV